MHQLVKKAFYRINAYLKIPKSVTDLYWAVKMYLPNNPVVLEAGAHEGFDTFGLSTIWPDGKVYSFEPVPNLFKELKDRVSNKRNVKIYNVALGEVTKTMRMYISSGDSSGSSSLMKPTEHLQIYPGVEFKTTLDVAMTSLNDWSQQEEVARIDLMWLDMQGYEMNALKGASRLLDNVSVIYTELCRRPLYEGMKTQDEYVSFLKHAGFTFVKVIVLSLSHYLISVFSCQ